MAPLHLKKMSDTRARGYLWLSLLIVLTLIGLLVWGTLRGREIQEYPADTDSSLVDSTASKRPYSPRSHSASLPRHYASSSSSASRSSVRCTVSQDDSQYSAPLHFPAPKPFVFELNSADTNDLKELDNIGSYFAKAIVRYRNRLGGFHSVEQLLEVPGMTPDRYHRALRNAVCNIDTSLCTPLSVNSASLDQLKRHPYLDYWQAKSIVQLRSKGVRYQCPRDLLQVPLIDTATVRRLSPYLSFE